MCYDTAQLAYRIYRDAIRLKATPEEIEFLKEKWQRLKEGQPDFYHANGFEHPKLIVFSKDQDKLDISRAAWGLIPTWAQNEAKAKEIWNKTIIARGETMFEKPSFKESAASKRCIVPIDGFFEHFHQNGKTFPYYIQRKDKKRMLMGGLKNEWTNPATGEIIESFAIITTKANEVMTQIHNNPKIKESRMPLLLEDKDAETWFEGSKNEIMDLIHPNTSQELITKTVKSIRGKNYIGNTAEAHEEHEYAELTDGNVNGQTSLF